MKTSESIEKLAEALSKAQGQLINPEKNKVANIPTKTGGSYSYSYADLPCIFDSARKALFENGLAHCSTVESREHGQFLCMRLMHSSGQWIESSYQLSPNNDPKQRAAEITYGRRYLFSALIGVAADEDTDSEPEVPGAKYEQKKADKPKPKVEPKAPVAPKEPKPEPKDDVYRIPFGPYKGNALAEVSSRDLRAYMRFLEDEAQKKGKPIEGIVLTFMDETLRHLGKADQVAETS